jgi:hypothetical protein
MGPQDSQIVRTFISQGPPSPLRAADTVRDTDSNLRLVIESEFGAAFPNVPTIVSATIVDRTNLTVVFSTGTVVITPTPPNVQTVITIPGTPFTGRANHTCEITAFLSANVNPAFPPDASFATDLLLVTD